MYEPGDDYEENASELSAMVVLTVRASSILSLRTPLKEIHTRLKRDGGLASILSLNACGELFHHLKKKGEKSGSLSSECNH